MTTVASTDGSSVAAEPFRHHNRRIRAVSGYADIAENRLMLVTEPRVSYNDKVSTTDSHTNSAVQASLKRNSMAQPHDIPPRADLLISSSGGGFPLLDLDG